MAQDLENYLNGDPLTARPATTGYFLRKRVTKHRTALLGTAAVIGLLLGSVGAYAWQQYDRKILLPIETNPPGAMVVLNGISQLKCGRTPCVVELTRGVHDIRIVHDSAPYAPVQRRVTVAWGQASNDSRAAFVLMPQFRMVDFNVAPGGGMLTLYRTDAAGRDQPPRELVLPATAVLPTGHYRMDVNSTEGQPLALAELNDQGEFQIVAGFEPIEMNLTVRPAATP